MILLLLFLQAVLADFEMRGQTALAGAVDGSLCAVGLQSIRFDCP